MFGVVETVDERFSLEINCHYYLIHTCGNNHTVAFLPRPEKQLQNQILMLHIFVQKSLLTSTVYLLTKPIDVIEVPRSMLSDLSSGVPDFVSVHALTRVDYGMRVLVEPATVEDWELLEIYGAFIEDGGLLSQVSLVYPFQKLTLRIGGMDRATIRVTEIFTGAFSGPGNDVPLVWPDVSSKGSGGNGSNEYNSSPKCALLIQDTEIVVKPKTRSKKKIPSWSDPFRLIPSDADWGESFGKLTMLTGRGSFHVDPGCVLIKTEQWPFQSIWAQIKSDRSNQISVVRVVTSSRIPPQNAGKLS